MKKLLLLFIIPFLSFGQDWVQVFVPTSSAHPVHVNETTDGGYIIVAKNGLEYEWFEYQFFRTNSFGDMIWSWTDTSNSIINAMFLKESDDGSFIFISDVFNEQTNEIYSKLIEIGPNGILAEIALSGLSGYTSWFNTDYSNVGDFFLYPITSCQITSDGGFLFSQTSLSGFEGSDSIPTFSCIVKKFDSLNNIEWEQNIVYPMPTNTAVYRPEFLFQDIIGSATYYASELPFWGKPEIIEVENQSYYIINSITNNIGPFSDSVIDGRPVITKLDSLGNILWENVLDDDFGNFHSFGGVNSDDGGCVVVGSSLYYNFNDDLSLVSASLLGLVSNISVFKTDLNGDTLWTKSIGWETDSIIDLIYDPPYGDDVYYGTSAFSAVGIDIINSNDGGIVVLGHFPFDDYFSPVFPSGPFLMKLDSDGNTVWTQNNYFNDGQNNNLNDGTFAMGAEINQASDNGYVITGSLWDQGVSKFFLIKTDSFGNANYISIDDPLDVSKKLITTIDVLGREAANKGLQLEIYDDGSVEKKYLIK
tara:strand:- start:1 stop:1599 length:1599 start_codon:yes stop_codon:yes gene_type:complete